MDCDAPGVDRFHFEGRVSDADLNDYYLAVFERPLRRARPAAIMCSFASVNGVPSCANGLMQNTLARQTWGFEGALLKNTIDLPNLSLLLASCSVAACEPATPTPGGYRVHRHGLRRSGFLEPGALLDGLTARGCGRGLAQRQVRLDIISHARIR